MKTCTKCGKPKPLDAFYKNSRARDKRTARCKQCVDEYQLSSAEARRCRDASQIQIPLEKICTKCKISKPISRFSRDSRKRDGLCYYCKDCSSKIASAHHVANYDHRLAYAAQYQRDNPEKTNQWKANYCLANPEKVAASKATWKKNNVPKTRANTAKRRAHRVTAQPIWADLKKIAAVYSEADRLTKQTGLAHHVDHIVPLLGPIAKNGPFKGYRLVCGLHCETNLQILLGKENLSKSNRTWPDMP